MHKFAYIRLQPSFVRLPHVDLGMAVMSSLVLAEGGWTLVPNST